MRGVLLAVGVLWAAAAQAAPPPTLRPWRDCIEYGVSGLRAKAGERKAVVSSSDVGNITIISLEGDYTRGNQLPRRQLAQAFLAQRPDEFDFLVVFTTFEFESAGALAFYNPVRNDVRGIGWPVFDNGVDYGSPTRLQGVVDMAALGRYSFDVSGPGYQLVLNTLAHEIMHRWSVMPRYRDAGGQLRDDLLGSDGVHWSWFADTDASVMYGNDWQQLPDGRYRSVRVRHQYGPHDLYLAGLLSAAEVPPITLLRGAPGNATDLPQLGAIVTASAEPIPIERIIAAEGERVPSAADSPKSFNAGLILLKRPGESVPASVLADLERLRVNFQQRYSAMTRGRATLRLGTPPRLRAATGVPELVQPSSLSGSEVQLAPGLAWLRAQQRPDGRFEDDPGTVLRDTAYAIMALSELAPGDPAIERARGFLRTAPAASLEDHAWRAAGLPADREISLQAIEALRGGLEGYAPAIGHEPGLLDTQLAAATLIAEDPTPSRWRWVVDRTLAWQGADGGFGVHAGGAGAVRPTARALANLALVSGGDPDVGAARERARSWLLSRQQGSGAFGTLGASLTESLEVFAAQSGIALPVSDFDRLRGWLRSRQGGAGDFGGSVYATALALLTLSRDGAPNLAIFGQPQVDPASPVDGTLTRIVAVVENRGGGTAGPSALRFYDGEPGAGGTPVGSPLAVPSLSAGGRSTATVVWDTRGRAGPRRVFAVADAEAAVAESSEGDNTASVDVVVRAPPTGVELALAASDLEISPTTIAVAPVELVASGSLRNLGVLPAPGVLLRVVDATLPGATLAEVRVDVPAQGSAPFQLRWTRDQPRGLRIRVIADADAAFAEADEANNAVEREITASAGVDLALAGAAISLVGGGPVVAGQGARFRVSIENRGSSASPQFTLDATIVQGARRIDLPSQPVQVDAGATAQREFVWLADAPGQTRIEVVADRAGTVVESDESNNQSQLTFDVVAASGVNLAVDAASLQLTPGAPLEDAPLRANFIVRNLGADLSPAVAAALFDGDPRAAGRELARVVVAPLAGGEARELVIDVPALGARGDTVFYAMVDADREIAEVDEADNLAVRTVAVRGRADLAVALADIELDPSRPVIGEVVTATIRVRNSGQQAAPAFDVRLSEVGSGTVVVPPGRSVAGLAAGEAATVQWTWTFGLAPQVAALRVEVDPGAAVAESREDNNRVELPIVLQDGPLFTSLRYFSPNGDGVRDRVRIAWRLPVAESVVVEVRNVAGRVVRRLASDASVAIGDVTWDGRNTRGRIAPDGDYRLRVLGSAEGVIGVADVTLDTNRSTAVEAIGTARSRLANLPPTIPPNRGGWVVGPRGASTRLAVFGIGARPPAGTSQPRFKGLYRSDVLFPALKAVISQEWLARYVQQTGDYGAEIEDFEFLPEDRGVLFMILLTPNNGAPRFVFGVTRADAVDTPTVFGAPIVVEGGASPDVAGVLDARTAVLRLATGGASPWRLLDLASGTRAPFASDLDGGWAVARATSRGAVFVREAFPGTSWRFAPRAGGPSVDLGTWPGAVLSPDGETLAVLDVVDARQQAAVVRVFDGLRRDLVAVERQGFAFDPGDVQYPDQLTLSWVARAGELLVIDAKAGRALSFAADGEALGAIDVPLDFPPLQALSDGEILIGTAPSVHYGRATTGTQTGCFAAESWLGERAVRQWYLGAEDIAQITFGRTTALLAPGSEGGVERLLREDGTIQYAVNLADGVASPSTDRVPAWMFADGSHVTCDGSLVSAAGTLVRTGWELAPAIVDVSADESTLLLTGLSGAGAPPSGGRVLGTFLNLPTVLRAEPAGRAIRLYGLAMDRQFERWELEFASTTAPTQWQSVTSPSSEEVVLDDFLYWTPPEVGTYSVRLRAFDRAGNVETATTQVVSQFPADIGSLSVSPRAVSPNGDGVQDELVVDYSVRRPTTVRIEVRDVAGVARRSTTRTVGSTELGPAQWRWDGRDDDGVLVPDGRYTLWINEQRVPLLVDTRAPTGAPELWAPYRASGGTHAEVSLAPPRALPVTDPNLQRNTLESDDGSGWRVLADRTPGGSDVIEVALEDYVGRSFRLVSTDSAGNRTIFPLGDAAEEISIATRYGLTRPTSATPRPRLETSGVNRHPAPFTNPPESGVPFLWPAPPGLDVFAVTSTLADLVEVEYETAPLSNDPQWTVRARAARDQTATAACQRIGVAAGDCPLPGTPDRWIYLTPVPDPGALAEARAFLSRVVGRRADGTRVGSNWVRFEPGDAGAELACVSQASTPGARESLRRRLLAAAGIDPANAGADLRMAVIDLPVGDRLRPPYTLDLVAGRAGVALTAVDDGILFRVDAPVVASLPSTGLPAVVRVDTERQGRRALGAKLQPCTAPPAAPLLQANVAPVLGAECAAEPSNRVSLGLRTQVAGTSVALRRLVVDLRDPVTGARTTVLDRALSPAITVGSVVGQPAVAEIDTTGWAGGAAELLASVDTGAGLQPLDPISFPIDRERPNTAIHSPAEGSRVCAVFREPADLVVPTEGAVDGGDPGWVRYQIGIGEGAAPQAWSELRDPAEGPRNGVLGDASIFIEAPGFGPRRPVNGTATLRVRAWDWSGAQVCARSTVHVDSKVEIDDEEEPRPLLGTTASVPLLGLSGRGDYARIALPFVLGERVDFALTLHSLATPDSPDSSLVDPPLAEVQSGFASPPALQVLWDGVLGGSPVAEGVYGLRLALVDACGFRTKFEYRLRIDRTPPVLAITQPASGAALGGLEVEVRGTVEDPQLARWDLMAGASGAGGVLAPVADGTVPVASPAVLGSWRRGSLSGPATVALLAVDRLDNSARIDVPIVLDAPSQLVVSGSAEPAEFSPNGDGLRDRTRLAVVAARALRATVRVVDAGGAPVRTLATDALVAAGAASWDWDGRTSGGAVAPEGAYRFELVAADAAVPANAETHRFTAFLDLTPPVLTPLEEGDFVAGGLALGVDIYDARLERYDVELREVSSGSVLARRSGSEPRAEVLADSDALAEAAHRLLASASDRAGNRADLDHPFSVDRSAPEVALAAPAADSVLRRGTPVPVEGTVTDSNLQRWDVTLERAGSPPVAIGNGTGSVTAATLLQWPVNHPEGSYTLVLTGTDRAGNRSRTERALAIDATPPVAVITHPLDGAALRARLEIDGTASDTHFRRYVIAIAPASGPQAGQYSDLFEGDSAVVAGRLAEADLARPEGDYRLRLTVEDRSGQLSVATTTVRIDREPPPAPTGLVATPVAQRDVGLDWNDVVAADLAHYRIYRNDALVADGVGPSAWRDIDAPEGRLRYTVAAVDRAGNESPRSGVATVTLDRTAPTVALVTPAEGESVSGIVTVRATIRSDDDLENWQLELISPGGATTSLAAGAQDVITSSITDWDTRALSDGSTWQLRLRALDRAANAAQVQVAVTVDNGPPATPTGLTATPNVDDVSLDWAPNTESDLLGYLVYRDGILLTASEALPPDLRPYAITADAWLDENVGDGQRRYRVAAIDRAGNVSALSDEVTVTLDTSPPRLFWVEPDSGARFDATIRLRVQSPDADIAEVRFAWRPAAGGPWTPLGAPITAAPYVLDWAPGTLAFGEYELRALARDGGGREDPQPPVVTVRYSDLTPPGPPTGLDVRTDGFDVVTTWLGSPSTDVTAYRIYRSAWLSPSELVGQVPASAREFTETVGGLGVQSRTVVAVDAEGNFSSIPAMESAPVYAIAVDPPFTPVAVPASPLSGSCPADGTVAVTVVSGMTSVDLPSSACDDDGRFAITAAPLSAGANAIRIRGIDPDGNRSVVAETGIDRAVPPGAPTGLAANVAGITVDLAWAPRPAAEHVVGHRVFRNGAAVRPDEDTPLLTATSPFLSQPSRAIDEDPGTAVDVEPGYDGRYEQPIWIELRAPQVEALHGLRLASSNAARRIVDADVEAWSGTRWVRVARMQGNEAAERYLPFDIVYRTQRVRLLVLRVPILVGGTLAELDLVRRPWIAGTAWSQVVPEGRHRYQVSAIEPFAFEGTPSDALVVDVGDVVPPDPVVLGGTIDGTNAVLQWSASGSADVASYRIRRDGRDIASVAASAERLFVDAARPNGTYVYTVVAMDGFDNASAPSNGVSLTFASARPEPPVWSSLEPAPEGGALQLRWQPGPGAVVARFVVQRADAAAGPFVPVATTSQISFRDAPLDNGRTYHYRLVAEDAAGNTSDPGPVRAGMPRDSQPPALPLLTVPTRGGATLTTRVDRSTVCGLAEAGAAITLRSDRDAVATTTAADGWAWTAVGSSVQGTLGWAVSRDGRRIFESEFGRQSTLRDLGRGTVRLWSGSAQRAAFAGDGRSVLLVDFFGPALRRLDFDTGVATDVSTDFAEIITIAPHPDGRRVVVIARDRDQPDDEAAWLLDLIAGTRQRLASFPDGLPFPSQLFWSPDATRLLTTRAGPTGMVRVLGLDGTTQDTPVGDIRTAAQWLPQGDRVLVMEALAQGVRLREVQLGSGASVDRLDFAGVVETFAVAPSGTHVALQGSQRLDVVELASGAIRSTVSSGQDLQWTDSSRLVSFRTDGTNYVDLPGAFCADGFPLLAGSNRIVAAARDPSGNAGADSLPIDVVLDAGALPDLAIADADVRAVPASGRVGDTFSIVVTVRNRGATAAPAAPVVLRVSAPDGSQRTLPAQSSGELLAGAARTLEFPLGALDRAGSWTIHATVDGGGSVLESDESNNRAQRGIAVSATGAPLLEIALQQAVVAPAGTLEGRVTVSNPGSSFSGRLRVVVLDAAGSAVATLLDLAVPSLEFGTARSFPVSWPATGRSAGTYRIAASLADAMAAPVAAAESAFTVDAFRIVALDLIGVPATVPRGQPLRGRMALALRAGNTALADAELRFEAIDADARSLVVASRRLGALRPGYEAEVPFEVPTSAAAVGPVRLLASISASDGEAARSERTVAVVDVSAPAPVLGGAIELTPDADVQPGRDARLDWRVRNAGSVALPGVALRLRILADGAAGAVVTRDDTLALEPGAEATRTLDLAAVALALGRYRAVLEARLPGDPAGTWRLLAARSLPVTDGEPPEISDLSPDATRAVRTPLALSARAFDRHSAIQSVQVQLDSAAWTDLALGPDGRLQREITVLAEGPHAFRVRAIDRYGNVAVTAPVGFVVDNTPPVVTIAGVVDGQLGNTDVVPTVSMADADLDAAQSVLRVDGLPFVSGTAVTSEGAHLLFARAVDRAGNATERRIAFTIDRTAPMLQFVAPANGTTTTATSVDVRLASEVGARVALSTGAYLAESTAASDGSADFSAVPLLPGANTLVARALDTAGNASPERSITVTRNDPSNGTLTGTVQSPPAVDRGGDLSVSVVARNGTALAMAQQRFRLRALAGGGSLVLEQREFVRDLAPGGETTQAYALATATWPLGPVALVFETETAGAWIQLDTAAVQVVDGTAPVLEVLRPAPGGVVRNPVGIEARASDLGSGIDAVNVRIDLGIAIPMVRDAGDAGRFLLTSAPLAEGAHRLDVEALDAAGNRAAAVDRPFVVDDTAPAISFGGVADGAFSNAAEIVPTVAVADAHPDTLTTTLDGQPWSPGTPVASEGSHRVDATAVDRAGNRTDASLRFTLDRTPPTIAIVSPAADALVIADRVDVVGDTEPFALVVVSRDAFSATVPADAAGRFVVPDVPLDVGSNTLRARATDRAGNLGPEALRSVRHAPNAGATLTATLSITPGEGEPGISPTLAWTLGNPGPTAVQSLPVRVSFQAAGDPGRTIVQSLSVSLAAGASVPGTASATTGGLALGAYAGLVEAQLTGTDGTSAWTVIASAPFALVDTTPPLVAIVTPAAGSVHGAFVDIGVAASDALSAIDGVEARLAGGPWQVLSPQPGFAGRFVGRLATDAEGAVQVGARARDAANQFGSAEAITIVVDRTPPQVTIAGVPPEDQPVNIAVLPTFSVNDATATTLALTLDGQAYAQGTAIVADGEHVLRAVATDAAGNTAESAVRFTIDRTPPVVVVLTPAPGTQTTAATVLVAGTTEPLSTLRLVVGSTTLDATSTALGAFEFAEAPLAIGANTLGVTATDRAGNAGQPTIVSVTRIAPPAPVIDGRIDLVDKIWPAGAALSVPTTLRNTGTVPASAARFRLLVTTIEGGYGVANALATLDLPAGATAKRSFDFATTLWPQTELRLSLQHDLGTVVSPDWVVLDDHVIALGGTCFQGALFADGFEDGGGVAVFGDGFEPCTVAQLPTAAASMLDAVAGPVARSAPGPAPVPPTSPEPPWARLADAPRRDPPRGPSSMTMPQALPSNRRGLPT